MEHTSIQEVASKYLREEVKSIDPIVGKGFVNEIYALTTESSKWVLRVDPTEASISRFQKEAWCMERAGGLGIPVPAVLGLGMYEAHPYILISYIEGSHGPDVDEEGKRLIWSKLGEYLMKIHQIKTEGYGEDMTAPGVFDGSWSKYLEYNISSLNSEDKLLAQGIISADQSAVLKRTFLELRDAQLTFGLIHNDVSLKNSILGSDGKVYLLDWGSAGVEAIPHMDFAEVLRSSLKEDSIEFALFREAYGISAKELERIKPEISKLQMLGFADKVRWAMDRKPEFLEEKAQELRQALAASRL